MAERKSYGSQIAATSKKRVLEVPKIIFPKTILIKFWLFILPHEPVIDLSMCPIAQEKLGKITLKSEKICVQGNSELKPVLCKLFSACVRIIKFLFMYLPVLSQKSGNFLKIQSYTN